MTCAGKARKRSTHGTRIFEKFGITQEQYDALFAAQGGVCAICKGRRPYNLDVDHDHELEAQVYRRLRPYVACCVSSVTGIFFRVLETQPPLYVLLLSIWNTHRLLESCSLLRKK